MTTDLDELLKLLEEQLQEKELKKAPKKLETDSTKRFIDTMNIRRGLDRVPNYIIYYTYKKRYKKDIGEERWAKVHFFRVFNKYFDPVRNGRQRSYLLDGSSFDLTREGRIEAKAYDEEYRRKIGIKTGRIKPGRRSKKPKKLGRTIGKQKG